MFRELLYIHTLLRRDLATVQTLSREVLEGRSPESIVEEVRNLETNSPLWQLKYGCLVYCRFVHGHHTLEDYAVFPMVRKHDPELNSVVDRLMEDHRTIHDITERITSIAGELTNDESAASRNKLAEALGELEDDLLAHLDLEEQAIGPLLSTWDHWPVS